MPLFINDNDPTCQQARQAYRYRSYASDKPKELKYRRRARMPNKEFRLRKKELKVIHAITKCNRKMRQLYKELAEIRQTIIREKELS